MAKIFGAVVVFAAALCFSSFLSSASANDVLYVEGKVYCDVCRVEFETPISIPLSGAKVNLECRSPVNDSLTYSKEGLTEITGSYSLAVEGDHEEEICEVKLVKSPREDCKEVFKSANYARVVISKNMGLVEPVRFANALGFMQKVANPDCDQVLQSIGFLPIKY